MGQGVIHHRSVPRQIIYHQAAASQDLVATQKLPGAPFDYHRNPGSLPERASSGNRRVETKAGFRWWEAFLYQKVQEGELSPEEFEVQMTGSNYEHDEPPASVKAEKLVLARLDSDLAALARMFAQEAPPQITVRVTKLLAVYYGFRDASGLGFGNSFQKANGINYCIGVWGSDVEKESSNYKELKNCIMALRRQAEAGALASSEVFFFTNNSTAELTIH
jgi:hypothetical protein